MAFTSTVAGLALGFATETGTEYLNDTLGALASEVVGDHPPTRYQSQNLHFIPKMARPDSHFLARMPLTAPTQDLALAGVLPRWDVGNQQAGQLLQADLVEDITLPIMREVLDWAGTDSNFRFYGEPLALLALLGFGGVGTAALSVASLMALVRRGRSVQSVQVQIRDAALAILADEALRGNPQSDPIEGQVYTLVTPTARAVGSVTYGGLGSKYNKICEDSMGFVARTDGSLVAFVFDGAGGSGNGFRATSLANQTLIGLTQDCEGSAMPTQDLLAAVRHANTVIYEDNSAQHGPIDEDTTSKIYAYGTVAGVDVSPTNQVTAVGVGDSRVITLRGGKVLAEGTTELHNYAQELVDQNLIRPEAYYTHDMNNMITKDVGMHENLEDPSVKVFQAQVGDLCVIVSDGVVDVVTLYEIAQLSKKHKTARALQKAIYDLAYARNQTIRDYTIRFNATTAITMPPSGDLIFPKTIMTLVSQAEINQIIATSNTAEDVRTHVVALADSRRDPTAIADTAWAVIVSEIKGCGDNIAVAVVKITAAPVRP